MEDINFALSLSGLVAGIVSVVVAVIAIGLSVAFYISARNAEKAVGTELAGIKAQTGTLEKIAGQQLSRLTKVVSETQKTSSDLLERLVGIQPPGLFQQTEEAKTHEPSGTTISGHEIPNFPEKIDVNYFREVVIIFYYTLYYYTSYANLFAQYQLPPMEEYDETSALHRLARKVLDASASDFRALAAQLDQWLERDRDFLVNHPDFAIAQEGALVQSLIRSADQRFADLEAAKQPSGTT